MKSLLLVFLIVVVLLPLQVLADGKGQQRRKKAKAAKVSVKGKKKVVRKTSLVSKRKRTVVATKKPLPVYSNVAQVFSYCHEDSDSLSYTIYFKKVFTEAVKIGYEVDLDRPNWKPSPNGWEGLKDYKVLIALYNALQPIAIDVYPGASSANSSIVNNLILEKKNWLADDIAKANSILEDHIKGLGYVAVINNSGCVIANMRPREIATNEVSQ